jgi:hypothetical protein
VSGPAATIDEVVDRLDEVIARSRREASRLGYFAILYRGVTAAVRDGIAAGRFDDGPRMERLDVTFANRYLAAVERHRQGEATSRCWTTAFTAAAQWRPVVLQHLLLGMNAHINLDLGVAAALTCPGDRLPALRRDFDEINDILAAMLNGVQDRLGRISPWMGLVDRLGGRTDEAVLHWSIQKAREAAWNLARRLAPLRPARLDAEVRAVDGLVDLLAHGVRYPGWLLSVGNFVVRLSEPRSVATIMDLLTGAGGPAGRRAGSETASPSP